MTVDGTVTGETITKEPEQGSTIVLTIDSKLQEVAETALKNNIEKIRNAEVDELLEIPEMTIKAAENVYAFFHMQNNDKES